MRVQTVLLLIATVFAGARVIQEGEKDATCFPEDFETYRWVLAGNTWFTETDIFGNWLTVADECAKIERGRTSLGGPRSDLENSRLKKHFHYDKYYMNAIQVGGIKWYWCVRILGKPIKLENMSWTNWDEDQPDQECQSCGIIWYGNKKWDDEYCLHSYKGVCELRCDSL